MLLRQGSWIVESPNNPVKEGAGWAFQVPEDRSSTAAVLMVCPEDRPAGFFSSPSDGPPLDRSASGPAL
jgi:hypothetical protein